jgi:hypothetical protein
MSARLVELVTHREPDLTSPRSIEIQREAFRKHGLVVVPTRGKPSGLPRLVQIAIEAWARVKFA